ncbi:hypothetical protein DM828_12625 [Pseudomonas umsongensis]|nr:hypothetical protein [Pseudomonas umsongensis]
MLAMVFNDDAGSLVPRGALRFIASILAPTSYVLVFNLVHRRVVKRAMEAGKSSTVNNLSITVLGG